MAEYILEFVDYRPVLELSAPGPQGATGAGIVVRDELASTANLPPLPNPSLLPGDAYIIAGELWVYTAAGEFVNTGFVEGAPGPQGIQGIQGVKGDQGIQGIQGPVGPKGDKGDVGEKGEQGTSIAIKGTLANSGLLPALPQNPQDAYIINGDLWVWDGDSWVNVGAFRGPQGEAGVQGVKGDNGESAYQVAVDNGFVGTEAAWLISLKGPKGDDGADSTVPGPQGIQGPIGNTGPKGDKGDTGLQGIQGIQGPKGDTGNTGAAGKAINLAMFSANGNVATFVGTTRFYVGAAGNITVSKAALGTSGSTATTVVVKKNGTAAVTMTIASGTNVITSNTTVAVAANDYITVDVTAAGTGAKDLSVIVRIEE